MRLFGLVRPWVLVLVGLLLVGLFFGRGTAQAQDKYAQDWLDSNVACWSSGPLWGNLEHQFPEAPDDESYWGNRDEFVVQLSDLGDKFRSVQTSGFVADAKMPGDVDDRYKEGPLVKESGGRGPLASKQYLKKVFVVGMASGGVGVSREVDGIRFDNGVPFTGLYVGRAYLEGKLFTGSRETSGSNLIYYHRGSRISGGRAPDLSALKDENGNVLAVLAQDPVAEDAFAVAYGDTVPPTTYDGEFRPPALFRSLADAVDYTFYADFMSAEDIMLADGSPPITAYGAHKTQDYRMGYLSWLLFTGSGGPDKPDWGKTVPWESQSAYLKRRSVAAINKDRVKVYSAEWLNPDNPAGGFRNDQVEGLRDQRALQSDLAVTQRRTAGDGYRRIEGVEEHVTQKFLRDTILDCTDPTCNLRISENSEPETVLGNFVANDQNNNESVRTDLGYGVREVDVIGATNLAERAVQTVPGSFSASTVDERVDGSGGYSSFLMVDTDNDEFHVNIRLDGALRSDYRFNAGNFLKLINAPGMGDSSSKWTYDLVDKGRLAELNNRVDHDPLLDGGVPEKHFGYRQPTLGRAYFCVDSPDCGVAARDTAPGPVGSGDSLDVSTAGHIRWPVNFEDLNWYLYELPGASHTDSRWLLWVSDWGKKYLTHSGYGKTAATAAELPECQVASIKDPPVPEVLTQGGVPADVSLPKPLLKSKNIACFFEGDPARPLADSFGLEDFWKGNLDDVFFPFDTVVPAIGPPGYQTPETRLVRDDGNGFKLVKAGVESPEDAGEPVGDRDMSHYSFVIREGVAMGRPDVEAEGQGQLKRYGVPLKPDMMRKYMDEWPNEPIDPNRPYMMVVTFYEVLRGTGVSSGEGGKRGFFVLGEDQAAGRFEIPKRNIRRVVCRLMVVPPGFSSEVQEQKSFLSRQVDKVKVVLSNEFQALSGWLLSLLRSWSTSALALVQKGGELTCEGMVKLDSLTGLDNLTPSSVQTRVTSSGVLDVNEVIRNRNAGIDQCRRVSVPPRPVCETDIDHVAVGRCVSVPELKLVVRNREFVDLATHVDGVGYGLFGAEGRKVYWDLEMGGVAVGEDPDYDAETVDVDTAKFLPAVSSTSTDQITRHNVGLTRANIGWDFVWKGVSSEVYDEIDGVILYVYPDEKSSVGSGPYVYVLPRWMVEYRVEDTDPYSKNALAKHEFLNFSVGGLNKYPHEYYGSNPLVRVLNEDGFRDYEDVDNPQYTGSFWPVGGQRVRADFFGVVERLTNMPLAPGFTHRFQIQAYVGQPGTESFKEGPISDFLELNGDKEACFIPNTTTNYLPLHLKDEYDCRGLSQNADLGYEEDEGFRIGLLSLTGSNLCDDIFSSTPAGFTWDNPVVKQVWGLVWIIAGGVLFGLLVMQGFRMTYDVWVDPQPMVGFREMMPRFLLAIALAAGSLLLCQLVLVMSSDLTCFVAQMTGMSMWGVIGTTFGAIMSGFLVWAERVVNYSSGLPFLSMLKIVGGLLVGVFVVVVLFLGVLIMFIKVAIGMVLRIALLAVLTAVSPLAFVMFASEATAHWTKKWLGMFFGAAFQQVLVLIVIYIGGHLMARYLSDSGDSSLAVLVTGLLIGFVTLALAEKVPQTLASSNKDLFSSAGDMGRMAVSGGVMAASVGGYAAYGGIRGFFPEGGAGGGRGPGAPGATPRGRPPTGGGGGDDAVVLEGNTGNAGRAGGADQGGPRNISALSGGTFNAPGEGGEQPEPVQPGGNVPSSSQTQAGGYQGFGTPPVVLGMGGTPRGGRRGGGQESGTGETGSGEAPGGRRGGFMGGVGRGAGQVGSGFRNLVPNMLGGARQGVRRGAGANLRMRDAISGNFLYRNSSAGDDAARVQQERARAAARARDEESEERTENREALERLGGIMSRIEERL